MTWSEQALRATHAELSALDSLSSRSPCPNEDQLEALLLGELEPEERLRVAEHLEGCTVCATLVRELGALEAWSEEAAAALPEGRSRAAGRWMALAASLVIAIGGLSWWLRQGPPAGDDVVRASAAVSGAAMSPAVGARSQMPPTVFEWSPQPGAEGYRLTILDVAGEPLWRSPWQTESRSSVPASTAVLWSDEGTYFWTVEVEGPVLRRELGPNAFRVIPSGRP